MLLLPVAANVLDGLEQGLLAFGAAGATVARHVGIGDAEFGATACDIAPERIERNGRSARLVGPKRQSHSLFLRECT